MKKNQKEYKCVCCDVVVGWVVGTGRGYTYFEDGTIQIGFNYFCSDRCLKRKK